MVQLTRKFPLSVWRRVRKLFRSIPTAQNVDEAGKEEKDRELQLADSECPDADPASAHVVVESLAQLLPTEILLAILGDLSQGSVTVSSSPSASKPEFKVHDLVNSILTCRSWARVGNELLYSTPILPSGRPTQLFARTLRDSPQIAHFVRQLILVDHDNFTIYQRGPLLKRFGDDFFEELKNEKQHARRELLECLRLCTSLTSMSLVYHSRYIGTEVPLEQTFVPGSALGHQLRKLEIYGDGSSVHNRTAPLMSRNIHLPALEVLCLHSFLFIAAQQFPVFPKLHTLQVSKAISIHDPHLLQIDAVHFPALRCLDLYQNDPWVCTAIDDDCLENLERLTLVGDAELDLYLSKRGQICMDRVKHLTLKTWNRSSRLTYRFTASQRDIRFPRDLESLTILVKHRTGRRYQPGREEKTLLQDLHDVLASGTEESKNFKALCVVRDLDIMANDSEEVHASLEKLQQLCDSRRVTMQIAHNGVLWCHQKLDRVMGLTNGLDEDDWIQGLLRQNGTSIPSLIAPQPDTRGPSRHWSLNTEI